MGGLHVSVCADVMCIHTQYITFAEAWSVLKLKFVAYSTVVTSPAEYAARVCANQGKFRLWTKDYSTVALLE